MSKKEIWQGNEALAEAAVRAGCRFFAGYPITPQTEIVEYLSWRLPEVDGVYLQAESELSAINMLIGGSIAGERVMTASSNPGIALMTEAFGAAASARLPMVIVDVQRAGAANVGITASQSDYNLLTKTFGPGGLRACVLGPASVQELVDIMGVAFDIADRYRTPVVVLTESIIGQMMEPVTFDNVLPDKQYDKTPYTPSGRHDRSRILIQDSPTGKIIGKNPNSVGLNAQAAYRSYEAMYNELTEQETRYEDYMLEDAEYVIAAWGCCARICLDVVKNLRADGIKVGIFRPITLYPFPHKRLAQFDPQKIKGAMCVELAIPAQLYHDVRESLNQDIPLVSHTNGAGIVTDPAEVEAHFREAFL